MYSFENKLSDLYHDSSSMNALNMYIKEIYNLPLLSDEEEKRYGKMLLNPQDKKLLLLSDVDSYNIVGLNIALLFNSLCNNVSYGDIINDLILFYNSLDSSDQVIYTLIKYQNESNRIGRALNNSELQSIFGITNNEKVLKESDLLKEIKDFMNYKLAFKKMFEGNLRLVNSIAMKYKGNIDIMDLIQEGNSGLMKAIIGFDVSLGNKFSTYATTCIKQTIRRYVYSNSSSVRLPEYVGNDLFAFKKRLSNLEQKENRELSPDEIAERLNLPYNLVLDYLSYMNNELSLDVDLSDGDGLTMRDAIPSSEDVEEIVMKSTLRDDIKDILSVLKEREQDIVKMKFGLGEYGGRVYKVREISEKYSISPQRVTEIFHRSLYIMKRSAKKDGKQKSLKDYTYR